MTTSSGSGRENQLEMTLEITADTTDGIDKNKQRILLENANTFMYMFTCNRTGAFIDGLVDFLHQTYLNEFSNRSVAVSAD